MRKIYLLLDEWNSDKNFVEKELDVFSKFFDVTVICNSINAEHRQDIPFYEYKRPGVLYCVPSLAKMFFERDFWQEIKYVFKEKNILRKISEVIRFYVNADCFSKYMKKNGYINADSDAIYYSYWFFWKCYALTKNKRKYPGIKVITRTHEYDLYDYTIGSGYQPFKLAMDEQLDKIIFIADHGRDYYLQKYNKKLTDKYLLYYLGTADGGLNNYKYESNRIKLVSCSSVIKRKRVDLIIDALEKIDSINVDWVHFGAGDLDDEIKGKAEQVLGLKKNITYKFMGLVTNHKIIEYYKNNSVDLFITTTSSEGNPVSVMEAMSFGIPVIATSVCNLPNMIDGNGILVSDNPTGEELGDAITGFAEKSYDEIYKMRRRSRELWEFNYVATVNNKKFVEEVLCVE